MSKILFFLTVLSVLTLSGCGIKGELYMPDFEYELKLPCGHFVDDECDLHEDDDLDEDDYDDDD